MTPHFQKQMQRLAGLKFAPSTLSTHWEGLSDVSDVDLKRAVDHAVKVCESFPSPAELRRFAIETIPEIVGMDSGEYRCEHCANTGWVTVPEQITHVKKCACWGTNPVLIRRRERGAQQAAHRTAVVHD